VHVSRCAFNGRCWSNAGFSAPKTGRQAREWAVNVVLCGGHFRHVVGRAGNRARPDSEGTAEGSINFLSLHRVLAPLAARLDNRKALRNLSFRSTPN